MPPVIRIPFEVNRFKVGANRLPHIRSFKSIALYYILLEWFKFQNSGFIVLTICLWHRAIQFQLAVPGKLIKTQKAVRFPKEQLLSIKDPNDQI